METEAARFIAKGLIILSMIATPVGEAMVAAKAMEAMGRNPSVADAMFTRMIVAMAICESTAIYALVAFFII